MAQAQLSAVFRHLRQLGAAAVSDSQLLQRFVFDRDESAFTALLERHGRLVWGVCRHVLRHEQDAEDAFQATFIILARKAGSIRKHESVASWLYGVAYRVALKARARASAQRARKRLDVREAIPEPPAEASLRELQSILDEEVNRLPEQLRAPFVLCCLQGRSKNEAARELGWKEGTVSGRLALAREKLRSRLARRGVALSAGLTAVALTQGTAAAAVPSALGRATLAAVMGRSAAPSAVVLAQGVLRALFASKVKMLAGLVLMLVACAAGTGLAYREPKAAPQEPPSENAAAPQLDPRPDAREAAKLPPRPAPRLDVLGDPLPPGAVARLGTTRLRHGGTVQAVAITPAGRGGGSLLASAGSDHVIHLWDPDSGKLRYTLPGHPGNVRCLAFAPDGKTLASGGAGPLLFWDLTQLDKPGMKPTEAEGHTGDTLTVVFSRDGKRLYSGGQDSNLLIRDPSNGKVRQRITTNAKWIRSIALSPDGQTIALAQLTGNFPMKGTVQLRDAKTGRELRQLGPELKTIYQVAFSPDGLTLAVAADERLRLFEVASGAELHGRRRPLGNGAFCTAFTPDGKTVIAGSSGRLRRWKVATGRELPPFEGEQNYFYSLGFTPDGKTLAGGGTRTISLWDVSTGKERRRAPGHPGEVNALLFSPDSKRLLTGGYGAELRQWDLDTGRQTGQFTASCEGVLSTGTWSQVTGKRSMDRNGNAVRSPDGKKVVIQGINLVFGLLDATTGKQLHLFEGHKPKRGVFAQTAMAFAFTPDGKTLASAAMGRIDRTIILWDVQTGKEIRRLVGPPNGPVALAISSDGKLLASSFWDGNLSIWEVASGKEVHRLSLGGWGHPRLAFAPGSWLLAVGRGGTVTLLDAAAGRKVTEWTGPQGEIAGLAFSRDGHILAVTGNRDNLTYLYETVSRKVRLKLGGHAGAVKGVSFALNGRLLATGSDDTTVLLWDLPALVLGEQAPVARLSPQRLDELWKILAGADAAAAYRAVLELAHGPKEAVPFLEKQLHVVSAKNLDKLIAQLDDDDFPVREKATAALIALGRSAESALRKAAEDGSAEVRSRARRILKELARGASSDILRLRDLRALEILELIATPEARHILESVAKGTPEAERTQAARAALTRLGQRPAP